MAQISSHLHCGSYRSQLYRQGFTPLLTDILFQLLGIFVCVVSAGAFLVRYGIPTVGQAIGYLAFGIGFVAIGLIAGQMLEASVFDLLVLAKWNFNLSLMAIGYSAIVSGIVGLYTAIRKFSSTTGDQQSTE